MGKSEGCITTYGLQFFVFANVITYYLHRSITRWGIMAKELKYANAYYFYPEEIFMFSCFFPYTNGKEIEIPTIIM